MPPDILGRLLDRFARYMQSRVDPEACQHAWVICGAVLSDVSLDAECLKCGTCGSVKNPTEEEWMRADGSISRPYEWDQPSRVVVGEAPRRAV